MEHAEHDKEDTRHERGDGKALEAVLLDDTINNNNERARRTTNLHFGASEDRDKETSHDGGDDALLGCHARSNTEGNGQRQGNDADNDTCQQVGSELFLTVVLERRNQLRFKLY